MYIFLEDIRRSRTPRLSEDEQMHGQAVLCSPITSPLSKQRLSQLADQHLLCACTGKFVLTSHKRFSSCCALMSFLLVSVKVECLRVPEIAQCPNVNAHNLAGRKSGTLQVACKYFCV